MKKGGICAMPEYRTDVISLLKDGDLHINYIELTSSIISSPYIESSVKLDLLSRIVDAYNILKNYENTNL